MTADVHVQQLGLVCQDFAASAPAPSAQLLRVMLIRTLPAMLHRPALCSLLIHSCDRNLRNMLLSDSGKLQLIDNEVRSSGGVHQHHRP